MRLTMWRAVALAGMLTLTAMPALAQDAAVDQGIDLANLDLAADPAADFNQFVNGGWMDAAEIRADRSSTSSFQELSDETLQLMMALIDEKAGDPSLDPASDQAKAVADYAQGMDLETRNRLGVEPITPELARIEGLESLDDLWVYQQDSMWDGIGGYLPIGPSPDLKDSNTYALYLGTGGYGLPNQDYYTDPAVGTPEIIEAYLVANTKMLEFAGYAPDEARAEAEAVLELERQLVDVSWTREEEQDISNFYNPMTLAELADAAPYMDWAAYFAAMGLEGHEQVIVTDPNYLTELPAILAATDIETIKAALTLRAMWGSAADLSDEIGETAFNFGGRVLSGLEQRSPLEERVYRNVEGQLGFALGKLYVDEKFSPEAKEEMLVIADDVIDAFRVRLENNTWMTPETKAKAIAKLDKIGVQVGYPDTWETYEDVAIGDNYYATGLNSYRHALKKSIEDSKKPVDRNEWGMLPQTVNAYYSSQKNQIVFPAAFLQAPYFDPEADPAVNYGAIGYVIGHELTHGFDKQGSQFDADGNLVTWWTEEDQAAFDALNEELVAQYSAIEVAPGLFVNGELSIGENTADLGGVQIAWDALQARLARDGVELGEADGVLEAPFTPAELFYLSAGTVWRNKTRPEALVTQVNTDSHAPSMVRVAQPLRNHEPFFEVIGVEEGDPLWLAPEERVVIW